VPRAQAPRRTADVHLQHGTTSRSSATSRSSQQAVRCSSRRAGAVTFTSNGEHTIDVAARCRTATAEQHVLGSTRGQCGGTWRLRPAVAAAAFCTSGGSGRPDLAEQRGDEGVHRFPTTDDTRAVKRHDSGTTSGVCADSPVTAGGAMYVMAKSTITQRQHQADRVGSGGGGGSGPSNGRAAAAARSGARSRSMNLSDRSAKT